MVSIIVKNQVEGIHCYPNAPEEVTFLRQPHRHLFHVETKIEVFHNDRELEFIMVKRRLQEFLEDLVKGAWQITQSYNNRRFLEDCFSCEDIAIAVKYWIQERYPILQDGRRMVADRKVSVTVFEDGENGAMVE